jgi:hypothetical protein
MGILMLWSVGTGAVFVQDGLLKCPFRIRKLVCGVTLLLKNSSRLLIESGISMYFMEDSATAYTAKYFINV